MSGTLNFEAEMDGEDVYIIKKGKKDNAREKLKIYVAKNKRIARKMGVRGKMSYIAGGFGAALGAAAGLGIGSGAGAVAGGTGGFALGAAVEGPARKRQMTVSKNI